jgi:DNA-binding response OmpR family regulator
MREPSPIKKILVVDDDHGMIKLLSSTLSGKGYDVKTTDQAADGLQSAIHEQPDLIILDVMMPIINGYNFCRLLKNEENKKHIPIILLTARDEMEDVEIGMEMGAEAYLTKPVNINELFRTIKVVESLGSSKK